MLSLIVSSSIPVTTRSKNATTANVIATFGSKLPLAISRIPTSAQNDQNAAQNPAAADHEVLLVIEAYAVLTVHEAPMVPPVVLVLKENAVHLV